MQKVIFTLLLNFCFLISIHAQFGPSISISKSALDDTDTQIIASGETAEFKIIVANTGSVTLLNVTVTDPLSPICDMVINSLGVGQTVTYTCSEANVTAGFTNVATVNASSAADGSADPDSDGTDVVICTAPVLSCPDNIIIHLDPGACDAVVTWNPAIVTGDCGIPVVTQIGGPISGTTFDGNTTTTILYQAMDQSGNTSTCSFNIEIIEFIPISNEITCNNLVHISLDENCEATVGADQILEGDNYGCYDDYVVTFTETGLPVILNGSHVGNIYEVMVVGPTGNPCWGNILVEDKLIPGLVCAPATVRCDESTSPEDISFPVPTGATVDFQNNNTFTVSNFDPCGEVTLIYSDALSGELCGGDKTIVREWTATDESGNTTSCTQTISITPVKISDLDLPTDVTLECGDDTSPSNTGGLDPLCENIGTYSSDNIIDICGGSYKILRTWTIADWCTNEVEEYLQIIKVLDIQSPDLSCPADMTISTNSNSCEGGVVLEYPTASDCGTGAADISFVPTSTSGVITFNSLIQAWVISDLDIDFHYVKWTATDGCGNESECEVEIKVEDQVAPIAICDEFTIVGIGTDGTASVDATMFDDGSYDNCGIVEMTARRMNNPFCINFNETDFLPMVPFYCCDVNTTVMVEFRVKDAQGNVNSCMVEVEVQDKIDPIVTCPEDKDIECSESYLDYIVVGQPLPQAAIDANGSALGDDNCTNLQSLTNVVISNTVDCGNGTIQISWTATDVGGRTASCIQRYFVENNTPFYIVDTEHRNTPFNSPDNLIPNPGTYPYPLSGLPTLVGVAPHTTHDGVEWPDDLELTTCGLGLEPSELEANGVNPLDTRPTIFEGACNNIAVGHHDQVLDFGAADACLKIFRKWYVVDWCQASSNQDPTQLGPGVWHYTQVIKVINSTPPTVSCEPDNPVDFYPNFNEDCAPVFVPLMAVAMDDCTPPDLLEYTWSVSNGATGVGSNAGQEFENGDYTITFTVADLCGNTTECVSSFSVIDAKKPTPVCLFGIATTVMPSSGSITIFATDFETGSSFDNCTVYEDLYFSFAPITDFNNIIDEITIDCDDVPPNGLIPISLYVTDEAGNSDFCSTFIEIQDPNGACSTPTSIITGTIENEVQEDIEEVIVTLSDPLVIYPNPVVTSANGEYAFTGISTTLDYNVTPEKDINYLNGVTTYDLVLISKHILGTELLDSPYKVIAADANNSQSLTTLDIVKLRALILHIDDELEANNSWRFVDANHLFTNPINPWETTIPEVINLTGDGSLFDPANFTAVKIGDVNGTASPNSLLGSDSRTFAGELALSLESTQVAAGEIFTVDFRANEFKNIAGYQFTLGFDNNAVEFVDVTSNLAGLDAANFGLTKLGEGVITTSWNSNEGVTVANGETLFSMTFRANAAVNTKELLSINSRYTESEAYAGTAYGSDLYNVVLEFNGSTVSNGFELFQNTPNPFKAETTIGFNVPTAGAVTLTIYDVSGRVLRLIEVEAVKGFNSVNVSRAGIDATGVLYYQLETATETATKKMILVD